MYCEKFQPASQDRNMIWHTEIRGGKTNSSYTNRLTILRSTQPGYSYISFIDIWLTSQSDPQDVGMSLTNSLSQTLKKKSISTLNPSTLQPSDPQTLRPLDLGSVPASTSGTTSPLQPHLESMRTKSWNDLDSKSFHEGDGWLDLMNRLGGGLIVFLVIWGELRERSSRISLIFPFSHGKFYSLQVYTMRAKIRGGPDTGGNTEDCGGWQGGTL